MIPSRVARWLERVKERLALVRLNCIVLHNDAAAHPALIMLLLISDRVPPISGSQREHRQSIIDHGTIVLLLRRSSIYPQSD